MIITVKIEGVLEARMEDMRYTGGGSNDEHERCIATAKAFIGKCADEALRLMEATTTTDV